MPASSVTHSAETIPACRFVSVLPLLFLFYCAFLFCCAEAESLLVQLTVVVMNSLRAVLLAAPTFL
ncbi:MAG: hypothetical protein DMG61_16710 [Acidobacteria bacterium]|nr:MAG: hypothetical protein DMG61_16710 [Acidobacteriota bacterium]